ncbi:MAG TPA: hypothetical protein VGR57_20055 [Ktedonobacterales bacterium]|nr:hypothetical protein [Ktedonobacterales bacterium]
MRLYASLLRSLEALCGLLAAAVGADALILLVIDPAAYTGEHCESLPTSPPTPPVCTPLHATFLAISGGTGVINLVIIAIMLLAIAGAAIWHAWRGSPRARTVLWLATGALAVYAFLSQLSIGTLLFPSVGLALLATLAALWRAWSPAPAR